MSAEDETDSLAFDGPLSQAERMQSLWRAVEETRKFTAEQHKLMAEAAKFNRDSTWGYALAIVGGVSGLLSAIIVLLRLMLPHL